MDKKRYFFVNFLWDGNIYCANIAHADSIKTVEKAYSRYGWYHVRDIQDGELEMAKRKRIPIIEL